jgi:nitrite reductase (NO-forming)
VDVTQRSIWLPRANGVVLAWLAVTALCVFGAQRWDLPAWLAVHALLLGAVSTAILVWSEHFAVAVLHARQPARVEATARLAALTLGASAVLAGRMAGLVWLLVAGAVISAGAVGWHLVALRRMSRRGLGGVLAGVVRYYEAACVALLAGATLGALLGADLGGPALHARLLAAHLHLNVLGWVLLTVLGTLFMLWPVLLRTTIAASTAWALRWCLRLAGGGLAVATLGMLLGVRPAAAAGLAGYAAGVLVAARPLLAAVRGRRPRSGAGWLVAASVVWLVGAVVADTVAVAATTDWEALPDRLFAIGPVLLVGVVVQVLLGSLVHLLPVASGGGPGAVRAASAVMERGWPVRLVALNLAVMLVLLPAPAPTVGWWLAGLVVLDAVGRGAWVILSGAGLARARIATVAGVTAGLVLTAVAVTMAGSGNDASTGVVVAGSGVQEVEVRLAGMRIRPAMLTVAPGVHLRLKVVNEDAQQHDLRLATGQRTAALRHGQSATLDVGPVTTALEGWCTIAGHRAAGMTMTIAPPGVTPTDAPHGDASHAGHGDMAAPFSAGFSPYPARLAPAGATTTHRLELRVTERELEVAPGVRQRMWTFGGTVPGPVLRGRVGDVFEVTLINDGTLGHGIDFHAGELAPDVPMRTLNPGERLVYRFRATHAGAWLYHCSTAPLLQHVGNGMYGTVIIDPPGLPTVDKEYLLVSGELYLGEPGSLAQVAKMTAGTPDAWMFNGAANGYLAAPLPARAGERVRVWAVAAGPSDGLAFHVVGAQFDTVYKEGAWLLRPGPAHGAAQVLDLAAAQGGFVELTFPEAGHYPFVDHDLRHAGAGAAGTFVVEG